MESWGKELVVSLEASAWGVTLMVEECFPNRDPEAESVDDWGCVPWDSDRCRGPRGP